MSGFLLLLVKSNLAMGVAIVLVSLIRRPLRAQFGAPIAYAIWLLVPIASVASLLPPREVPAPAHVASMPATAAPAPIMGDTAHSALRAVEQLAGQSVLMLPAPMKPPASTYGLFDTSLLLFAAWALGTLFMAVYLARVQIRFSAAVRRGQAGPAVLGFFFPRIVTPGGFQEQFTPQEQAAILAHERVHLARQDARINALAALLRCFCWFNPLIHLGARFLRIDQELACDAIAVSGAISRRDYSMALLKSQVMVGVLPFGCNWPGPQHPLVERIALLQRKPPGTARRLAGMSLVLLMAASAGLGAWAAQPPVAAKPMTAPSIVLAALPAIVMAPDRIAREPVTNANPAGGDNSVDVSDSVPPNKAISATPVPVRVEAPRTVGIAALTGTVSAAPPQIASSIALLDTANQTTDRTSPDALPESPDTSTGSTATAPATQNTSAAGSGVPSVAAAAPRFESAFQCYLRFGPTSCKKKDCDGSNVKRVYYLGSNATGADIYEVRFMDRYGAFVIAPDPDGKTGHYRVKAGEPYWIKQEVSSPTAPNLIYTKPENAPGCFGNGGLIFPSSNGSDSMSWSPP